MVLELDLLLNDDTKKVLYESQKKRFKSTEVLEECEEMYKKWKVAVGAYDGIRMKINANQKEITEIKKKSKGQDPCTELLAIKEQLQKEEAEATKLEEQLKKEVQIKYSKVGNLVHESVPLSDNEDDNKVVHTWGTPWKVDIPEKGIPGKARHHEILNWIGGFDPERGTKVSGHRGFFLTGWGVLLNQALINYGLQFLTKKNYKAIQPPYFMKKEIMEETCQLSDFEESLYKVTTDEKSEPNFLIATSEQPISGMYRNEWIDIKELPLNLAGVSTCFRKEAGSGKDIQGIFRVHQFEKIEQFLITTPEESWKAHESMMEISKEFYENLELPYQVISIVSGALNDAAAKKYDLEAWFPGEKKYRELVSCSNCTDYQSRSLNIRMRDQNSKEKKYVHMLNGTLTATERTMCCILENYQTEDGVKVPKVLQPFVGVEFIPFIKERLPGYEVEKKKKK